MAEPASFRRAYPPDAHLSTWLAADGWPLRRFDWAAQGTPRGSILFQGGRGDIIEKYLESFAYWHAKGWSITAFDWRGQGGSGRLSADPHVGHADSFTPFLADLAGFWADWTLTAPGPHVIAGHSMGGHLVLRALVEQSITPTAAVLVAPMLGLHAPLGLACVGELFARAMGSLGDAARPAWRDNEIPGAKTTRQALLTQDRDRYEDENFWKQAKPDLQLGPPSWAWVNEAFRSTRGLRHDAALKRMTVPVLALIADADKLVAPAAAVATLKRLPDARIVRFGAESAHEILREADSVRSRALDEIDRFLASRAPQR